MSKIFNSTIVLAAFLAFASVSFAQDREPTNRRAPVTLKRIGPNIWTRLRT
jgi:hypothetical protein